MSRDTGGRVKTKGRGHEPMKTGDLEDMDTREEGRGGAFESIPQPSGGKGSAAMSIEGWIIFITNVHPEAQEDDILDKFSDFGEVKNVNVNLDRRTGFVKGYALVEFAEYEEAFNAIKNMNGKEMLGQIIGVDWAFVKK